MPGACFFNNVWLSKPKFSQWLATDPSGSRRKGYCKVCKKAFDVSSMGESAVDTHGKGLKHKNNLRAASGTVAPLTSYMMSASSSRPAGMQRLTESPVPETSPVTESKTQKQSDLKSFATKSDVLKAEVLWAMKCQDSHYSMNSCSDIGLVFKKMFPDSNIASSFAAADKKTAYLCTYGLGPYFHSGLKAKIKSNSEYVLLFDETLNSDMQEKQMDVYARVWDVDCVQTLFYSSLFLGHATAEDMREKLNTVVTELGHNRLLQLSMDGPNVNHKVHRLLQQDIEKSAGTKKMLQTGTCGLHTLHNAFRSGCGATSWDLETLLTSVYHLFKDSPARRQDFVDVVQAPSFPLKFCRHRWLENVEPAERVILLLPFFVSYCSHAKSKTISQPTCKSFQDVLKMMGDPLVKAKLQFFVMIAKEIQPFLKLYQTDRPMVPFLATDLGNLIRDLMARFVKDSVLSEAKTVTGVCSIDYQNKANQLDPSKVDVGFSARRSLISTKDGASVSDKAKYTFRMECRDFLIAMLKKILEKSPTAYPLMRSLEWMNPRFIEKCNHDSKWKESMKKQMEKAVNFLVNSGRMVEEDGETVRKQFVKFSESVFEDKEFKFFEPSTDRVDQLFHRRMHDQKEYKELWNLIQKLLILSHGQATVERGFSVNRQTTTENLQKEGLIARRRIIQAVRNAGGPTCVPLTKELLGYAANARSTYETHLAAQKKERVSEAQAVKRKAQEQEVAELKRRRKGIETDIASMEKSADLKALDAEKFSRLPLLAESNAIRKGLKEKVASMEELDRMIKEKLAAVSSNGPSTSTS